jgi:hypothetical protein
MEDLKKVLQQLRKGAMSTEPTTRQKEIQVFIENLQSGLCMEIEIYLFSIMERLPATKKKPTDGEMLI